MPIEFDATLSAKDMYRFNMYQTYSGFHGWFSILFSILIFVVAGTTYGKVEMSYTLLYVVFGVIFLVYQTVRLLLSSMHSLAASEVLRKPLHYAVGEEGFTVSQGEESAALPWGQIYRIVATKSNVLVYSSRIHAYVIPRDQLGEAYGPLAKLAEEHLEKYRCKFR